MPRICFLREDHLSHKDTVGSISINFLFQNDQKAIYIDGNKTVRDKSSHDLLLFTLHRYRMNACVDVRLQREAQRERTSDGERLHASTLRTRLLSERSTGDVSWLPACFYVLWRMRTYFSSCFFSNRRIRELKTATDRTSDERPLTSTIAFCNESHWTGSESETLLWRVLATGVCACVCVVIEVKRVISSSV